MALAGWCGYCAAYVWLAADGSCTNGHAASAVVNVYEAGPPALLAAAQPPAAAATPSPAASAATPSPAASAAPVASATSGTPPATSPAPVATADPVTVPAAPDDSSHDIAADSPPIVEVAPPGSVAAARVRHDPDLDAVLLPAADLAALVAAAGAPGPLAPSLGADPSADGASGLAALAGRPAEILRAAAGVLASPARSAAVQYAVADEAVSRLTLAWSADGMQVAVVARRDADAIVSLRSPDAVFALLAGAAALEGTFEPLDVAHEVGAEGALAWVALADTLRLGRLRSMLDHVAPPDACSAADVAAALAGAGVEDFRWALNMLDKVLPGERAQLADPASAAGALDRLVAAGVLAAIPAEEGFPALYGLADAGDAALDAWVHEIGRLAATVRTPTEGGGAAAETVLLVRDARRLWLVEIDADRGALACLGAPAAERVLRTLAGTALPAGG